MYSVKVLCLAVFIWLAFAMGFESKQGSTQIELGFVDKKHPAIFTILNAGMTINITAIAYDSLGRLTGYDEEITYEQQKSVLLKIRTDPEMASKIADYRYSADINGQQIKSYSKAEWTKVEAKEYLGFSATEIGGVILRSSGGALSVNVTTGFSYDDFGRRRISTQKFIHEGISYELTYMDYSFDKFGRLSGYKAHIEKGK